MQDEIKASIAEETETSYVAQRMNAIDKAVVNLGAEAERLVGRLAPVLGPDSPMVDGAALAQVRESRSPHAERLDELTDRVDQIARVLRSATSRLDI